MSASAEGADSRSRRPRLREAAAWLAMGGFHLAMVGVVGGFFLFAVYGWGTLQQFFHVTASSQFGAGPSQLILHFALSGLLWAGIVWMFRAVRRDEEPERLVERRRGSVYLETLVVLVPFLLMTTGLAQLAMNNVASVLAHYAAFKGARAVWVWEPEAEAPRASGVDSEAEVLEKARVAIATAMAPSAPGDFPMDGGLPTELRQQRGAMVAQFKPGITSGNALGGQYTDDYAPNGGTMNTEGLTFARAFDSRGFGERAARKLSFAYHAVPESDLSIYEPTDREVGVSFTYHMQQVFPWFAYIWSDGREDIGGRYGHYIELERSAAMNRQVRSQWQEL